MQRSSLLPLSGIGVDGPFLIIAPPGNPAIRLDSRLLDRMDLISRSPTSPLVMSAIAAVGSVVGAVVAVPGGLLATLGLGFLAHERFSEARRRARTRDLLLALGSLEVALHVADGAEAAKRIVDQLMPYTREAPITRSEVYQDACRRRDAQIAGRIDQARASLSGVLSVGSDAVSVNGDFLTVGSVSFRIEEVRDYAVRGANLPLPGGRMLQAAMGLLVVAADERAREGEDLEALTRRITEYQKWTGHSSGR